MSEIKVGDVVDVAFKATVVNVGSTTLTVRHHDSSTSTPIWRNEATKPKPELPTEFGSVIKYNGQLWMRDPDLSGWYSQQDSDWNSDSDMQRFNFEVIRVGV
jgi:hypothetical protein